MSRRKKRRKGKPSARKTGSQANRALGPQGDRGESGPCPGAGAPRAQVQERIAALTARGKHRAAVDAAKEHHKQQGSPESEALLVEAYVARIQGMFEKNMPAEALALIDLVSQRHPRGRTRLTELRMRHGARSGLLDTVVAPLADPDLGRAERAEIEAVVRGEVTDLRALADCGALPADHALRVGAAALAEAFEAASSGAVDEKTLALEEVSRRSPLAPWKMLVRAIACFYRRDDDACLKCVDAMDSGSVPGRLAPVLRALVVNAPIETFPRAARALAEQVQGHRKDLDDSLARLDEALADERGFQVLKRTRQAVSVCRRTRPDLIERLRQHVSVRLHIDGAPTDLVRQLLGGPSLKNAYFWRLMACAAERTDDVWNACAYWEEFRLHALHEGWFPSDSVEESVVLMRMAALQRAEYDAGVSEFEGEGFGRHFQTLDRYYVDQRPEIRAAVSPSKRGQSECLTDVDAIYSRACALDPSPQSFRDWLAWAEQKGGGKDIDAVAQVWHEAAPEDPEPLLRLVESAERRNALKKALGYLEAAERLDGLDPRVRGTRLRLLAACARRHIENRKPHLLRKDIADITALDDAEDGDRPAYVAGLGWAAAALEGDGAGAGQFAGAAGDLLGSELAAYMLLAGLGECFEAKRKDLPRPPRKGVLKNEAALIEAVARTFALGGEMGVAVAVPETWQGRVLTALSRRSPKGNAAQFRAVAEGALRASDLTLTYVAAGAGIAQGPPTEARFLLLRARVLPHFPGDRWRPCAAAAAHLARQARDMDLVEEAVDLLRGGLGDAGYVMPWQVLDMAAGLNIPEEDVARVLRLEKKLRDGNSIEGGIRAYHEAFGAQWGLGGILGSMGPVPPPHDFEDFPDEVFGDQEEEFEDDYDDSQMDLFGDDPIEGLLAALFEVMARFPKHHGVPDLDEIFEKSPETGERLAEAMRRFAAYYGDEPDFEDILGSLDHEAAHGGSPGTSTKRKKRRRG